MLTPGETAIPRLISMIDQDLSGSSRSDGECPYRGLLGALRGHFVKAIGHQAGQSLQGIGGIGPIGL